MKRSRTRIQAAALTFILFPAAAGVLAVHASASCERFVRTYVTKPIRNRVSKQTADAWAKWREGHPNWKPNPNLKRPKYLMNREEAVQKVDIACTVPVIPALTDGFLSPVALDAPPPVPTAPLMSSEVTFPELTPPAVIEVAENTPIIPLVPTVQTQVPGVVPEPGSLLLAGTGFGFICVLLAARIREDEKTT